MSRFWAGFAVASLLWAAAAAYLFYGQGFGPPAEPVIEPVAEEPVVEEPEPEEEQPRRRRRRRRARRPRGTDETPTGVATTGDDLNEDEMRTVDMAGGGEQQLSGAQIEAGFDGAMGRIRRCLVLMEGGGAVTGRLTFGLRVAGSGQVQAVQLTGPRAATTGEAGGCLRGAARQIRFDSFDGPVMVVRYPITLE